MLKVTLIGLVFVLVGIVGLADTVVRAYQARRLRRHGVHTTGTVLEHVSHDEEAVSMVAQFAVPYGPPVTVTIAPSVTARGVIPVGDHLDILYLPEQPQSARPREAATTRLPHGLSSVLSLLVLYLTKSLRAERRLRRRLRQYGVQAAATVVRHEPNKRSPHPQEPVLCPMIGYTDQIGRTRTFPSPAQRGKSLPPIGRNMPVIYLPYRRGKQPQATPADIPPLPSILARLLGVCCAVAVGTFLLTMSE